MTTVFIAGSVTIKQLDFKVQERIMNILHQGFDVIVGDADGADTAVQQFLMNEQYQQVTVFCSGDKARNNVGNWAARPISTYYKPGSRAYFTAKDVAMAEAADTGLMIWDAKSTGTLSNVIELLIRKKAAWVFVNKDKEFQAVKNVHGLELLLERMNPSDRLKANSKIGLTERLETLSSREAQTVLTANAHAKEGELAS